MPALTNIRHERFALAYFRNPNASLAYRVAGYQTTTRNSLDVCASRMLRHAHVKARINELRRQMSYKKQVTVAALIDELETAQALAVETKQPGAYIQATQTKAKLVGLWVDRKEHGAPGDFAALDTREALLADARAKHGDAFADALASAFGKLDAKPAAPAPLALPSPDAFPPPSHELAGDSASDG